MFRKVSLLIMSISFILFPQQLYAASPHYVNSSALIYSNGHLIVDATVAGLGNGTHTYKLNGTSVTVTAGCRNNSGQFPNGTQKFAGSGLGWNVTDITGTTSNGNVWVYHDFSPVSGFVGTCPTGQTWTVKSVSGSINVIIDDGLFTGNITVKAA